MYTVEISIDHSNFPNYIHYYIHFTLLKVGNEERLLKSSYNLGTIITYCVSNGIDVKELSFENKLVKNEKDKRYI